MIGLWILFLADLQGGVQVTGEDEWCAARLVLTSPLLGFGIRGEWVAVPL